MELKPNCLPGMVPSDTPCLFKLALPVSLAQSETPPRATVFLDNKFWRDCGSFLNMLNFRSAAGVWKKCPSTKAQKQPSVH